MNLYLIKQDINNDYDTYDSAVVAAPDEEAARKMHPNGNNTAYEPVSRLGRPGCTGTWASPEHVSVEYLGTTERAAGVICASFNAGD